MAQTEKPRLIVFDVEGVLIPKNRFIFEVGKTLGFSGLVKLLFFGFLYEAGILKLESALKHIFKDMKGVKLETLLLFSAKFQQRPICKAFFASLKHATCKIALISSGIPTVIVKKLADCSWCRLRLWS